MSQIGKIRNRLSLSYRSALSAVPPAGERGRAASGAWGPRGTSASLWAFSAHPGGRAYAGQRALAAGRTPGVADAAAVPHEVHVHGVDLGRIVWPGHLREQRVGLLGRDLGVDDAQPARHAV